MAAYLDSSFKSMISKKYPTEIHMIHDLIREHIIETAEITEMPHLTISTKKIQVD